MEEKDEKMETKNETDTSTPLSQLFQRGFARSEGKPQTEDIEP
jgi:hypothetical protein